MKIVVSASVPPQPWRNGGGQTCELWAWPSAQDWVLRISVADIERDGPFSAWPGVQRWFQVLQGAGVELDLQGRTTCLTPNDPPLEFAGDAAPGCRLIDGPTRDLNLMLRRGRGGLHAAACGRPEAAVALYSAEAVSCTRPDGTRIELPAQALLWWGHAPPPTLQGRPRAWWIAHHDTEGAA
jgi:environmental stress-induced protein Ves